MLLLVSEVAVRCILSSTYFNKHQHVSWQGCVEKGENTTQRRVCYNGRTLAPVCASLSQQNRQPAYSRIYISLPAPRGVMNDRVSP